MERFFFERLRQAVETGNTEFLSENLPQAKEVFSSLPERDKLLCLYCRFLNNPTETNAERLLKALP
jgi:hypothetical protein